MKAKTTKRVELVREWHRDPILYREIYTRTVATLIAAIILAVLAAIAGVIDVTPQLIAAPLFLLGVAAALYAVYSLIVTMDLRRMTIAGVLALAVMGIADVLLSAV